MKKIRLKLMLYLYNSSSKVYANIFKWNKKPWGISKADFMNYPIGSIGHNLGLFYKSKGFDVMPKLENHDVFHILTETGTEIQDEIAMQFLLLGNGKISLYLIAMLLIGGTLFPEHFGYYKRHFQKGRSLQSFHRLEFKEILHWQLTEIQVALYSKNIQINLNS
ncbi:MULTISPECIES: hypothetical protein [unclassified Sphingobacterium]|uniref:hypothetical protein n=1 Tax=unclassified Sphingobacterium TaxID=2609468 RepID=UPI0025FFFDD6|nr:MULTISPECIES: hypothetical protein [unclassified Sphingobacterium]